MPFVFVLVAGLLIVELIRHRPSPEQRVAARAAPTTKVVTPEQRMQRRVMFGVFGGLFVVVSILTVIEFANQSAKGYVEVRCEHRCKIGGMDCRPPSQVASWQPPGPYTVQAYDPSSASGWTDVTIEVVEGERHTLVCKPPAAAQPEAERAP